MLEREQSIDYIRTPIQMQRRYIALIFAREFCVPRRNADVQNCDS